MHQIETLTFSSRKTKPGIVKDCNMIAKRESDSHGPLYHGIRFHDAVLKDRAEAERWIELNDSGWYDNLAVRYKDGRKILWLVKIEFHV